MTLTNRSEALRARAKNLEVLAALLEDPAIEAELAAMYQSKAESAPSAQPHRRVVSPRSPKRAANRRGGLEHKVQEVVKRQTVPVTARKVMEEMQADGFHFSAKNPYVAVSKTLRTLVDKLVLIGDQQGGRPKDPVFYSFPAPKLSVREIA
jgi:hypothetical protein